MNCYDAIIIGGGPGGSTAGSTLAQAGKKVLILERERFPRFHIGESLIPYANEDFRAIGVWEKLESAGFMPKLGAEFVLGTSEASVRVLFARYLSPDYGRTFQVERARFDKVLLDHAELSGCEVWQQDLLALDLPSQRFDGVFANAVLFHVPSQELPRVLAEL